MIGGVQAVIESARTVRDLLTGSYLMSWLTASAMEVVRKECGYKAFVTPHLKEDNPMLRALQGHPTGDALATLPSLPNKFTAEVPFDRAKALREACLKACSDEWKKISNVVRQKLEPVFSQHPDWARDWDAQVNSYLEIRCVWREVTGADDSPEWVQDWDRVGELMEMSRSVRHVPAYAPTADGGMFPAKCSLLGTFEQVGPAELSEARDFWKSLSSDENGWAGLHGTRLQSSDRLCAISLVKRFAWPAYFARVPNKSGGVDPGKLGVDVRELRYSDTATVAAARWLPAPERFGVEPDPQEGTFDWRSLRRWSGQWLHWLKRNQDKDEKPCPERIWQQIQARKRSHGQPPLYYAILMLDGDRMGEMFKGDLGPTDWGKGRERYRQITERLTAFSLYRARDIVEKHSGELIYAGGDDVLAFLPTETALPCALELRAAFRADDCLTAAASISGGIAVVHSKEDLRFALRQARDAEKAAKRIDRTGADPKTKNALALAVCRRSGEHTTAVLGWAQVGLLSSLVEYFRDRKEESRSGASDRWAYKLRAELPTLCQLSEVGPAVAGRALEAGRAEVKRLLGRIESAPTGFTQHVLSLLDGYCDEMRGAGRGWLEADILEGFVTLCQSASFLARRRE
jgi:CRISPR-associated protein Cmr2